MHRVVIRDGEAISAMLALMGATETVRNWEELRQRREVRATANRLVNFDDANLRRSAQAAVAACARVERAMELLGDDIPDHLKYAGELRLAHRDASLDELGHHADPPLTKDAVAGPHPSPARDGRQARRGARRPGHRGEPAGRPRRRLNASTVGAPKRAASLVMRRSGQAGRAGIGSDAAAVHRAGGPARPAC